MNTKDKILICESSEPVRNHLSRLIEGLRYDVTAVVTGEEAVLCAADNSVDLVVLNSTLQGAGGVAALKELREIDKDLPIIMITDTATFEIAVTAWRYGASECVKMPFDDAGLLKMVKKHIHSARERKNRISVESEREPSGQNSEEIDVDTRFERMCELILELNDRRNSGESIILLKGSDKEQNEELARRIHGNSQRTLAPFTVIECARLPLDLNQLERHLFGDAGNTYTGTGVIAAGDGGTIYLDEISLLQPPQQYRIRELLKKKGFTAYGGVSTSRVDVRFIAGTVADIQELVSQGRFRADLLDLFSVLPSELLELPKRDPQIIQIFSEYLTKFIEQTPILRALDSKAGNFELDFYEEIRNFERFLITNALEATQGHQVRASTLLGLNATTLNSKMKSLGISS